MKKEQFYVRSRGVCLAQNCRAHAQLTHPLHWFLPISLNPVVLQRERCKEGWPEEGCPICLSEFEEPRRTPCGHAFCRACLAQYMKKKAQCPVCRYKFAPWQIRNQVRLKTEICHITGILADYFSSKLKWIALPTCTITQLSCHVKTSSVSIEGEQILGDQQNTVRISICSPLSPSTYVAFKSRLRRIGI